MLSHLQAVIYVYLAIHGLLMVGDRARMTLSMDVRKQFLNVLSAAILIMANMVGLAARNAKVTVSI